MVIRFLGVLSALGWRNVEGGGIHLLLREAGKQCCGRTSFRWYLSRKSDRLLRRFGNANGWKDGPVWYSLDDKAKIMCKNLSVSLLRRMWWLFAVLLTCFSFPIDGISEDMVVSLRRTGQAISYRTGDDGDLQKGVAWPEPRFTDNGDGTVRDNLTRLVWMKNANCLARQRGANARSQVAGLNVGTVSCSGYTTGTHTDWRLPQIRELASLMDAGHSNPALPAGHPFSDVRSNYWSSTTHASLLGHVWYINLYNGFLDYEEAEEGGWYGVWPVRGGQ